MPAPLFAAFYPDGYTNQAFVREEPCAYPDVRFSYRPMLVEEIDQFDMAAEKKKSDVYDRMLAAKLAEKIVSWDVQTPATGGKPAEDVAVKPANLLRLHPALFLRISKIVFGRETSDVDPRWEDGAKEQTGADELESALSGQSAQRLTEAKDEKN